MDIVNQAKAAIKPPNVQVTAAANQRLAEQARPVGSLGILEPAAARLAGIAGTLDARLGLEPFLDLQFRLGEGTGAAVAMELLDAATRVLADIKTFAEVQIDDAQNA